jgi:hypothetical protein
MREKAKKSRVPPRKYSSTGGALISSGVSLRKVSHHESSTRGFGGKRKATISYLTRNRFHILELPPIRWIDTLLESKFPDKSATGFDLWRTTRKYLPDFTEKNIRTIKTTEKRTAPYCAFRLTSKRHGRLRSQCPSGSLLMVSPSRRSSQSTRLSFTTAVDVTAWHEAEPDY